jgi:adhesin HecA-like repeat protein
MPTWQPADIGPLFDFGITTRDGNPLTVKNKDGRNVQVSRLAYMAQGDLKTPIKEATELQEKDKLVQLASTALIDREFDQWPQVTQGDWSGGMGQRVFDTNSDRTRYWDGEGLLWPTADWVPQVALRGPTQGLPQGGSAAPGAADSGTQTAAPGGSQSVQQAALVLASFKATGVVAQVGALGAFATGSNIAVAPAFGQGTVATHCLVAQVSGQRQQFSGSANMGDTAAATSSNDFSGSGSDNVIATGDVFTVPAGGIYINSISVYFGGNTAAVNAILAVWDSVLGVVITNVPNTSYPQGLGLRSGNVTQTFVAAGTTLRVGFWRQQNQDSIWGVAASGTFLKLTNAGWPTGVPNTACAGPYVCGNIQAYFSYQQLLASDITQSNAGAAPGWVKIIQQNSPDNYQQVQIWAKPNCGAAETAPAFAAAQGASPMYARLSEWTNIALTSPPTDQSASNSNQSQTSITATAPSVDNNAGDLVISAGRWSLTATATAGFTKSFNNNIATIDGGDSGAASIQQHSAFAFGIVPSGPATFSQFALNGTAGGFIDGLGMGYAATYLDNQAPAHWHAAFFAGDQYFDVDLGANTPTRQGPLHMHIAGGYLWLLFSEFGSTNQLSLRMLGCAYGSNTFVQIRNDLIAPTTAGISGYVGLVVASFVGGHLYAAVLQADVDLPPNSPTVNRNVLYVLDYSAGTAAPPTGLAAPVVNWPFERGFKITDFCWQGNTLFVSASDGFTSYIYNLSAPFSQVNTISVIPGIANAFINSVGSTLFIVAWTSTSNGINRMALYTLDGGTLQEIPFNPIVPFLDSVTSPVAFGNYALWAVSYANPGGPVGQKAVSVYGFDAINSRLFRAITFTDPSWTGSDVFGHDVIGVYGVVTRTLAATATFQSQLGLAIFSGQMSNSRETAREFYWGVTPLTPAPPFAGLLQMGVNITSGLIDFTAATNKLFRATVSRFIKGLVANFALPSVTLNIWFNQDPGQIVSTVPDFTANTGTPVAPVPQELDLFLNQVARKIVYQVISTGGGFNGAQGWQNAPKLTDVILQAATGWVFDATLDLSSNAKVNAQNVQEYCYQHQGFDHVAAYNFLRQLWRQRGGQIILTLPNGDSYNALIQQMEFDSPKPFAASYRSDQQATYQALCVIKIREDI